MPMPFQSVTAVDCLRFTGSKKFVLKPSAIRSISKLIGVQLPRKKKSIGRNFLSMPSGKVLSQDAVDMIRYMHEYHKLPFSKIGELIGRPKNYISRILNKCDPVTGERILAKKGRHTKGNEQSDQKIRELALAYPYIGCDGLAKMYNETVETVEQRLSKSTIHRRLKHLGITIVKLPATTPELQEQKAFPKSQAVWRFQLAPEKKKRVIKKKKVVAEVTQNSEIPEAVPEMMMFMPITAEPDTSKPKEDLLARTISIMVFPPGRLPIELQPCDLSGIVSTSVDAAMPL